MGSGARLPPLVVRKTVVPSLRMGAAVSKPKKEDPKKPLVKPTRPASKGSAMFARGDLVVAITHALDHAATDETRPHLCCVQIKRMANDRVRFAGTDGHRAIAYTIVAEAEGDKDAELIISREEAKVLLAALKSQRRPEPPERFKLDFGAMTLQVGIASFKFREAKDITYPPLERVLVDPKRAATQNVFLDPSYIASALKACRSASDNVRLNIGRQLDPVRFDVAAKDSREAREVTVIVMPRRPD